MTIFTISANQKLMAVRDSGYKYLARRTHLYQANDAGFGLPAPREPWLIDLRRDDNESYDITAHDPERAKAMRKILLAKRSEMESNLRGWKD